MEVPRRHEKAPGDARRRSSGDVRVALPERLDAESSSKVRELLAGCLSSGVAKVVLDASRLRDLSTSGVGLLSGLAGHLGGRGGRVEVVNASESVARRLRINELGELLVARPTLKGLRGGGLQEPGRRADLSLVEHDTD